MKNLVHAFLVLVFPVIGYSQNISLTGNWSNTASWDAGNIGDLITENVTMDNSIGTITIQNTESYTIGNYDMGNSNTLTIDAGGALTIGGPGNEKVLTTNNGTIATIAGDLLCMVILLSITI